MLAGAETEMALRPPLDVVDVGLREFPPIAIARTEGESDLVADAPGAAMQCGRA